MCLFFFLCVQAFVIFCGLGINNTMMYNQVKKTWAKQSVALDVRPATYWSHQILLFFNHHFRRHLNIWCNIQCIIFCLCDFLFYFLLFFPPLFFLLLFLFIVYIFHYFAIIPLTFKKKFNKQTNKILVIMKDITENTLVTILFKSLDWLNLNV